MEVLGGGNTFIIALDTQGDWLPDAFEQAVMAAASLFCYAAQRYGAAQLWTPQWGLVQGIHPALEVLAQIEPNSTAQPLPKQSVIWLTSNSESLKTLPIGSRAMIWPQATARAVAEASETADALLSLEPGAIRISPALPLQVQLQTALR
jgi:uncharacterized protein (DUF58 family)